MAEGIKDSNEVIIQQTFSVPIDKEVQKNFLSEFSGNFNVEYYKTINLIKSENPGILHLMDTVVSSNVGNSSLQEINFLKLGMMMGYQLIRCSAASREITVPVVAEDGVRDLTKNILTSDGNLSKTEQGRVFDTDPLFLETIGALSMNMSEKNSFRKGAIIIHSVIDAKTQGIGFKPGRYGDILVK